MFNALYKIVDVRDPSVSVSVLDTGNSAIGRGRHRRGRVMTQINFFPGTVGYWEPLGNTGFYPW